MKKISFLIQYFQLFILMIHLEMEDETQNTISKTSGLTKTKPKKKGKGKTDKKYQNIQNFFEAQLDLQGQEPSVQTEVPKKVAATMVDPPKVQPYQKLQVIQPINPIEVQVEPKQQIQIVLLTCQLKNEAIIEVPKIPDQQQQNQKLQQLEVAPARIQQHNQQEVFELSSSINILTSKIKNKKQAKGNKSKKKQSKEQKQETFECNLEFQEEIEEKSIENTSPPQKSSKIQQVQQAINPQEDVEPEAIQLKPIQIYQQFKVNEQAEAQPQLEKQAQLQLHQQPQTSQTPLTQQKTSFDQRKQVQVIIPKTEVQQNIQQQQQLVLIGSNQASSSKPKTKKQSKTKTKKKEVKKQKQLQFQINLEEQQLEKKVIHENPHKQQVSQTQQVKIQSKDIKNVSIESKIQPLLQEPFKNQQYIQQNVYQQPKIQQTFTQKPAQKDEQPTNQQQPMVEIKQIINDRKINELIQVDQQSIIAFQKIQAPKAVKPKTKKQSKQKPKKKQTKNTFITEDYLEQQCQKDQKVIQNTKNQEVTQHQNNLFFHIQQQSNKKQQAIIQVAKIQQPKITNQQSPKPQIIHIQQKIEPALQFVHQEEAPNQKKIDQPIEQKETQIVKDIINNQIQSNIEQETLDITTNIKPVVINKQKSKKQAKTKNKKKQTKFQKELEINLEEQIDIKQEENIQKIVEQQFVQTQKIEEEEKVQATQIKVQKLQSHQKQETIVPKQTKQQMKEEKKIEPIVQPQTEKSVQTIPTPIVREQKQDTDNLSWINMRQQNQSEVVDFSVALTATSKKKTKKQAKGKGQKKQVKKINDVQQDFLVMPQSKSIRQEIIPQKLPQYSQDKLISIQNEVGSFKGHANIVNQSTFKQHHQECSKISIKTVIQREETLPSSKQAESDSSKVIAQLISLIRFHNDSQLRTIRDRMQMLEEDILSRKLRSLELPRVTAKKTDYQWIVEENVNLKRQYQALNLS